MFINKYYSYKKKLTFFILRHYCLTLIVLFATQIHSVTVCYIEIPNR